MGARFLLLMLVAHGDKQLPSQGSGPGGAEVSKVCSKGSY